MTSEQTQSAVEVALKAVAEVLATKAPDLARLAAQAVHAAVSSTPGPDSLGVDVISDKAKLTEQTRQIALDAADRRSTITTIIEQVLSVALSAALKAWLR